MNKALKILKISLYVILFACIVAIVVCYCIIPEQAKGVMDKIIEYLNTPIGITGLSIASIGYILYKIISMTSIGKVGLGTIKNDFGNVVQKVDNGLSKLEEKEKELAKKEEDLKVLLEGYSNKVNELSDSLVKVCETSPNAKIKALGEQFKGNVSILNNEINEKLEQGKNEFANVKEQVSLIDIQGKYNELLNELKALKEKIEYGEREETTND